MLTSKVNSTNDAYFFNNILLIVLLSVIFLSFQAHAAKGGKPGKPGGDDGSSNSTVTAENADFIAITLGSNRADSSTITLVDLDSNEPQWSISPHIGYDPFFSPDSEWVVYRSAESQPDGSKKYQLVIAKLSELSELSELSMQSIIFTRDTSFSDDQVVASEGNPVWVKIGLDDYIIIQHYSNNGPFYLEFIKIAPIDVGGSITGWTCLPPSCSETGEYNQLKCNGSPSPECLSVGDEYPSNLSIGHASDGLALYMSGFTTTKPITDVDAHERHKFYRFKIEEVDSMPVLSDKTLIRLPTGWATGLLGKEGGYSIWAVNDNSFTDEIWVVSTYHEEATKGPNSGDLTFKSSKIYYGNIFKNDDDSVYDVNLEMLYDSVIEKNPDIFEGVDVSCNRNKLLLSERRTEYTVSILDVAGNNSKEEIFNRNTTDAKWKQSCSNFFN